MRNIILDASTVIAVITNESSKPGIIDATIDANFLAPESIHWEIGNVFSSLFKKGFLTLEQAFSAIEIYNTIPIRFVSVDLKATLEIASRQNIYAYDAYLIECALQYKSALLTLDARLADIAELEGVTVIRIDQP